MFFFFISCGGSGKYFCGGKTCPSEFTNYSESLDDLTEAQERYFEKRDQFQLDNTYNQPALDALVNHDRELSKCLKATPLAGDTEFNNKKNNSSLREVHETNRYFLDKMNEQNFALIDCYSKAEKELDRMIERKG